MGHTLLRVRAALLAVALLTPIALVAGGSSAHALSTWTGTVTSIEDGDTFFVDVAGIGTQRIRMAGFNTNEANASGNCYAQEAENRLSQLILGKSVVLHARDANSSTAGRPIRHVFVGGVNVGEVMLREGFAVPLIFHVEPDYSEAYVGAWWDAHRAGRGLSNPNLCGWGPYPNLSLDMITNFDADESDATNQNDEWVMLRNTGGSTIDLTGWQIKDNSVEYYQFPNGTTIAPGSWIQAHSGSGTDGGNHLYMDFPWPIFSGTDAAYLIDPHGDIRAFDMWPCQGLCGSNPTPSLAIEHVQWDVPGPDAPNDEWIRIRNVGRSSVNLRDWAVASWPHINYSGNRWIAAGGSVTVYIGSGTGTASTMFMYNSGPILDTAGDVVLLIDPEGNVADCASFGASDCAYTPAKGDAASDLPDINGDGWSDLVVGAPQEAVGSLAAAGAVTIRYADDPGIRTVGGNNYQFSRVASHVWSQAGSVAGGVEADDRFGAAVATGDFDRDGYDDVLIGVPGEDLGGAIDAGQVNVLYGSRVGATTAGNQYFSQSGPLAGGPESGDAFGAAVASGDFNGDGYDDAAIGVVGENASTGLVHILRGSSAGLTTSGNATLSQGSVAEPGDRFGASLAVGDFNGDGFDDLVVGVPGEDVGSTTDAGSSDVFFGSASGLGSTSTPIGQWNANTGNAEPGDLFGHSLVAGDFDADGYDDLAAGSPGEAVGSTSSAGAVLVVPGSAGGLVKSSASTHYQGGGLGGWAEAGDLVGSALAAGDTNNDGFDDLVVGAPGEGIGSAAAAGAVHVLHGSWTGLSNDRVVYEGALGSWSEGGDSFGAALRVVDYDGDGRHDVLIGVPGENVGSVWDAGAVVLVYGDNAGVMAAGYRTFVQYGEMRGWNEPGDRFGAAL